VLEFGFSTKKVRRESRRRGKRQGGGLVVYVLDDAVRLLACCTGYNDPMKR
jgi:hypothetical protein